MSISVPADASKANMDASTDDPKQARADLADFVDKFNSLLDTVGGLDSLFLLLSGGGTVDGSVTLKNASGSGRQVRFTKADDTLVARFSLDDDSSSPQRFRYRMFDPSDGTTIWADMVFDENLMYWQLNAEDRFKITDTDVQVLNVPLKIQGYTAYHEGNLPATGAGWEKIDTVTTTAGSDTEIVFSNKFATGYDYRILLPSLKRYSGSSSNIEVQLGTGTSTISWSTGNYNTALYGSDGNSGAFSTNKTNDHARLTEQSQVGSGDNSGIEGELIIRDPANSAVMTRMHGDFWQRDNSSGFTFHSINRTAQADSSIKLVIGANYFNGLSVTLWRRPNENG